MRGRGKRVVRLQLDHWPHRDAHGAQCVLQRLELRQQRRLHAFARLVAGPEAIAERFDDVVGRDTEVRRAPLDELQHRMQDPGDAAIRPVLVLGEAPQAVEVTEQLVCPVDEMNDHSGRVPYDVQN